MNELRDAFTLRTDAMVKAVGAILFSVRRMMVSRKKIGLGTKITDTCVDGWDGPTVR